MNCLTLKKSDCKNCYKCIRNCPVKAIRFSGNQAHIVGNECIMCGQCFVVCPQNAKEIVGETEKVRVLIQSGDPVVVSLAPSFVANYEDVSISAMREALIKLGFAVEEEDIQLPGDGGVFCEGGEGQKGQDEEKQQKTFQHRKPPREGIKRVKG